MSRARALFAKGAVLAVWVAALATADRLIPSEWGRTAAVAVTAGPMAWALGRVDGARCRDTEGPGSG
ncbi:hypothetical protein EF912_32375 [Streptomyces sp. WAC07061]|uniref:hypothetical protein n=1 Tax=Streptomyces sp. WAC07061 TaxID=2487410 RepID=UPI000F798E53|nr:hypothetical protein [Streptomyces sp. WAC07061]RSS40310.1 hypothetical protein EF912_32375 [Streptomyces sp. WAC07061]